MTFSYKKMARAMLLAGSETNVARRYMQICRREKILRREARKANGPNPLWSIAFKVPISVVGEDSEVMRVAKELRLRGVPISLHLDGKKRPIGTPLAEIQLKLKIATGQTLGAVETLNLVNTWLHVQCLSEHPIKRFRRIPDFLNQIAGERVALEQRMLAYMQSESDRRFAAQVSTGVLRDALRERPKADTVLLSMRADGVFRVGKVTVPVQSYAGAARPWSHESNSSAPEAGRS